VAPAFARAVCVLDGPLREGEGSLLLVAPPGGFADSGDGGGGWRRNCVVRGLMLGPALQVAPQGRFLLYLSALLPAGAAAAAASSGLPAGAPAAEQLLRPVVEALTLTDGLRRVGAGGGADEAAAPGTSGDSAPAAGPRRPAALAVAYYTQRLDSAATDAFEDTGPPGGSGDAGRGGGATAALRGVVACPGPDGRLAGYSSVLSAAEALFRRRFPGLPWLSDSPPFAPKTARGGDGGDGDEAGATQPHGGAAAEEGSDSGGGGGGGGGAYGGDDGDDDDEAIDELQAALLELGMSLPGGPEGSLEDSRGKTQAP
jgi:hypothetical protein